MLATFSRRAAAELNRRVQRLLQRRLAAEAAAQATPAYAGTFHSIGARLLREYASRLGLDPQFTIHDREDFGRPDELGAARGGALGSARPVPDQGDVPRDLFARRQFAGAARGDARQTLSLGGRARGSLRGLFAGYVEAKQRQSVLDYDDLLLYFAKALAEPEIAAEIASRFDHLLVDEYQDTNRLQAEIALRLRPRGRGLTVVGDDAQSIYSFRAATVRNILDFPSFSTRRRASSPSIAIIARRSRSSPRQTP